MNLPHIGINTECLLGVVSGYVSRKISIIIHDTPTTSEMEANLAAAVASPPLSPLSAQGECLDALECEPVSTENQHHQDAAEGKTR